MRQSLLTTAFLFFSFIGFGQCPLFSIDLNSQTEIDSFVVDYPDCINLSTRLTVSGSDITNLLGLSQLESVDDLYIIDNPQLTSLAGLENLTNVDDELRIHENPVLSNLSGVSNLNTCAEINIENCPGISSLPNYNTLNTLGTLRITNNNGLFNMNGLENLTTLSEIIIINNDNLLNFEGLEGITEIDNFDISSNIGIQNFNGLQNVNSILTFRVANNHSIVDFTGLENVEEILSFDISNNDLLSNFNGLQEVTITGAEFSESFIKLNDNLTSISGFIDTFEQPTKLRITNNLALSNLSGFISNPSPIALQELTIDANDSLINLEGLDTISEINDLLIIAGNGSLENLTGLQTIFFNGGEVGIILNPALTTLGELAATGSTVSDLTVRLNDNLQNILGMENIEQVTNLDISFLPLITNLEGLSAMNVSFEISIRDNASLENLQGLGPFPVHTFEVEDNSLLVSLDGAEVIPSMGYMDIRNNTVLQDISALEYVDLIGPGLALTGNTQLSECSILSFCNYLDTFNIVEINNNGNGCNSETEILAGCSFNFNTLKGAVNFDFENNGCSFQDYPVSGAIVTATNGTDILSTNVNEFAEYQLFFPWQGTVDIGLNEESIPEYFQSDPSLATFNFTGLGTLEMQDFCITATSIIDDIQVFLIPLDEARPGFDSSYRILYENIGTTLISGAISLNFDDVKQMYLNAVPEETTVNGNLIEWSYENLEPFESRSITVNFNNFTPPINEDGDILNFIVNINPMEDDNPDNNIYTLEQIMVNSQDPNDKIVNQGEEILVSEVGDYLEYIIRFQNIGTASAINVRVEDVLDSNLVWGSFRVLGASDSYRLEIVDNNQVSFIFDDINLPSVDVDPEESNGYIAFQVKTKNNLQIGDFIENEANIFFDFNAPILTNTVRTTVTEILGINDLDFKGSIILLPNPVSNILTISTTNVNFIGAEVYSVSGQKLNETSAKQLNMSDLSAGIYFVKVISEKGSVTKKIVKQ